MIARAVEPVRQRVLSEIYRLSDQNRNGVTIVLLALRVIMSACVMQCTTQT